MFDYHLRFDSPQFLLLILLLPLLWIVSFRTLAGLGGFRRWVALLLRSAVVLLLIFAAAEATIVRDSDRLSVVYVVDQSLSVDSRKQDQIVRYLNQSVEKHRDAQHHDQAGIIVFGREPAVEVPAWDAPLAISDRFEATVDPESTNLAGALQLAQAVFPADAAKRVVVISDGNENLGDATEQAQRLAADGIGIDVIPLTRTARNEVAVESVVLPADVRQETPFDGRVVLQTYSRDSQRPVIGRLRISRTGSDRTDVLSEQPVTLTDPKHVFTFREQLTAPDFYTYTAAFIPENAEDDTLQQNNQAQAFTHIRGRGHVLLVEDWLKRGQFQHLVDRLREARMEVTVQSTEELFTSLAELQRYDAVIMADVPLISGEESGHFAEVSEQQQDILVRNIQQMGSGLVVLGGPDSFGAGGWMNTTLEKALPVDLQVKSAKTVPVGALVLVIDKSGSMAGEKLAMSKAAAIAALKVLSSKDYLGVVAFDTEAHWIVQAQTAENRERIADRIEHLGSDGGTDMSPAMAEGYRALERVTGAAVKHMIVLTDGQTNGANYESMAAAMNKKGITTTCVAVGQDSARQLLDSISRAGGGKFYYVDNPKSIPRIFMKEARRVARPLVYENPTGIPIERTFNHAILQGVEDNIPSITGYVLTTPKPVSLVEIPLRTPDPAGRTNAILATWQFGLGRSVILTTDVGQRWANTWMGWPGYDKLFGQIVRWSMRPTDDSAEFLLSTERQGSTVQVVVTALDPEGDFLNFLQLSGMAIGPKLQPLDLRLKQVAPGRYTGSFEAVAPGSYFLAVSAPGHAPIRTGVNVPYSAEFGDLETDVALLTKLAATQPRDGEPGVVIPEPVDEASLQAALETNVFRRDLPRGQSHQDIWPLLTFLAACLFFVDVLNRRVLVSFAWIAPAWERVKHWVGRRELAPVPLPTIDRLQARKAEVQQAIQGRRYAFDASTEPADAPSALEEMSPVSRPAVAASAKNIAAEPEAETYTSRLLKAKKQVWKERPAAGSD